MRVDSSLLDLTGGDIYEEYKQVMQDIGSLNDEMIDPLLIKIYKKSCVDTQDFLVLQSG